jgi:hypothetical protein
VTGRLGASPAAIGLRPAAPAASDAALRVCIPRAGEQLPRGNCSRLVEPSSEPGGLPKCCAAALAAAPPAHSEFRPSV